MPRSLFAAAVLSLVGFAATAQSTSNFHTVSFPSTFVNQAQPAASATRYALPLVFEPNQGQSDPEVRFLARGAGFTLYLTEREAVMAFPGKTPVRMHLSGTRTAAQIEGAEPTGGHSNYFPGNDPANWHTNIAHFRRVRYQGVYPGIDEVFYGDAGKLEYDLIVAPGADASQITTEYDGARSMHVDANGDLLLGTEAGELRMQRPTVYQLDAAGHRHLIAAAYRLRGAKRVEFTLARYDHSRPLVLDPTIAYATYLGGAGADVPTAIAVDASGNAYVTGYVAGAFPAVNAFQSKLPGTQNVFVSKINPSATALLYSTYIGGNGVDQGLGLAVDAQGNAFVTGTTTSSNFPVQGALQPARKTIFATSFVVKLDPSGSRLVFSTYLGGSTRDQAAGIALDSAGNPYIVGEADSKDFPVANALQATLQGSTFSTNGFNAFVTKLAADGSSFIFSTYLGGGSDNATGIAVDAQGNAYVVGATGSGNFPTKSPLQAKLAGHANGFLSKISPAGGLLYSSYLGGDDTDSAQAVAVDSQGNAFITGVTTSTAFPVRNALYTSGGAFVSKINPAGSALIYSTRFPAAVSNAIALDSSGDVYITGIRPDPSFPVKNAVQTQPSGGFLSAIAPDGSSLLYSTFLGGGPGATLGGATSVAVDGAGNAYVAAMGPGHLTPSAGVLGATQGNGFAVGFVAKVSSTTNTVAVVSGASFLPGVAVTPNSIASGFGNHLATQTAAASNTLGTSLGGTAVTIIDAKSVSTPAPLFFVSSGQVNFLIPPAVATGPAQIQITAGDGTVSQGTLQIANIAPGIFTAGNVPVGQAQQIDTQGNQTFINLAQYNATTGQFSSAPIRLAPGTSTYLILYGTGIRNAILSQVTMQIGNQAVTPAYAGIQPDFSGLDQINVQLPNSLGSGDTSITLTAGGITSNAVHVTIQ